MEIQLLEAVCNSDLTVFIVANYCQHPCANFFIYNERSNCWFQGRPERLEKYLNVSKGFIVVSSSAQENFRQAFLQHTNEEPNVLYLNAKEFGKESIAGNNLESRDAQKQLLAFFHALL